MKIEGNHNITISGNYNIINQYCNDDSITTQQAQAIKSAIDEAVVYLVKNKDFTKHKAYLLLYKTIKNALNISSYKDIDKADYKKALNTIKKLLKNIDNTSFDGWKEQIINIDTNNEVLKHLKSSVLNIDDEALKYIYENIMNYKDKN